MSAYSSLMLSNEVALKLYYQVLALPVPTCEEVERVLDEALAPYLYNVVVSDVEANRDDETTAESLLRTEWER